MRLEISYREKNVKNTNTWLNSTLLKNRDHWRNQGGSQKQWTHDDPKPMGCSKSSSKGEVYSNNVIPQETRNISNKQPKLTPKGTGERRTKKTPKLAEGKKS